ncbi:MAG: PEP/pyruvate-binding domain-containing protein [Candidatus Neomarinimicrobiota bacterium]
MVKSNSSVDQIIDALQERSKELYCLYQVEELLRNYNEPTETVLQWVVQIIPAGWQYPDLCQALIEYDSRIYATNNFEATAWQIEAPIRVHDEDLGRVVVNYRSTVPDEDNGPFFKEEKKLLKAIAERISNFVMHQQLKQIKQELSEVRAGRRRMDDRETLIVTELLYRTDTDLFLRIARKMLNFLCRKGIPEAEAILHDLSSDKLISNNARILGSNRPTKPKAKKNIIELSKLTFDIAGRFLSDEDIIDRIQNWIHEDKINFLIKSLNDPHSTIDEIADDFRRFRQLEVRENIRVSEHTLRSIRVQAIQRLLTEQTGYVTVAKEFIEMDDLAGLMERLIYPVNSHGQLGGKGAGMFLASRIVKRLSRNYPGLKNVRTPKTWYIASDGLIRFLYHNDLQDIVNQKYKDIDQIHQEYPQIIEIFKNSKFPPEMVQKLAVALDELGDVPIIVRSSSLLEDRLGSAFSGKYESLFLGNQGNKKDRLAALLDAIAEVYASTFCPDAIEYRTERNLLDSQEQMGVLIQEVVGRRVGPYFLPAFGGVALSNNEFRWSHRIKREDGLIRLAPGLGTRAVDRLSDDYPVLIAPGQPGLRVNVSIDEIVRYSPNKIDLINLESNSFETVDLKKFIRDYGEDFPPLQNMISILRDNHLRPPSLLDTDLTEVEVVATFDGLIKNTSFVADIREMLLGLQDSLGFPVDIEFASDGENFYLLQCRAQSYSKLTQPTEIPKNIDVKSILFSAKRYISNGYVPEITHIVYVDPNRYSEIGERDIMLRVGRAVSRLNLELPKRKFILMGPGRWGSRGDIRLGVSITYSDINNTAVLIEIARKKGNYLPDLSFGTHFFQDLVESEIRYLPLYPDDQGIQFNDAFLLESPSILTALLPGYEALQDIIRVIDVPQVTGGQILRIYMNADRDEALAVLVSKDN